MLKFLERWAKAELEPEEFWGSHYDDAIHEWGSAFLYGALFIAAAELAFVFALICLRVLVSL